MKGLTLTTKEQTRIQVLNGVIEGKVTVAEASGLMGVSAMRGDYWQHTEGKDLLRWLTGTGAGSPRPPRARRHERR